MYELRTEGKTTQVLDKRTAVLHSPNKGAVVAVERETKVAEFYGEHSVRQALLWIKAQQAVVTGLMSVYLDETDAEQVQAHQPLDMDAGKQ